MGSERKITSTPDPHYSGQTIHRYRGEKITEHRGFALPFSWLGTLCYATLDDACAAIDSAAWNKRGSAMHPEQTTMPEVREPIGHNHLFFPKDDNDFYGDPECPGCQTIDPYRMTIWYAKTNDSGRFTRKSRKSVAVQYRVG